MKKNHPSAGNSPDSLTEQVKAFARSRGFAPVGVTPAEPAEEAEERLRHWIDRGYGASMEYLARAHPRRGHPTDLLPEARSILCLAFNYYPGTPQLRHGGPSTGRIARYAVGKDYHWVLKKKLREIERFLAQIGGPETRSRSFVDSGPVLEREFARRAGLGFIGRNTHLITPTQGSWVFLCEVLTNLPLEPDKPIGVSCGSCTACLEACPTGALVEPFVLDSRKCISYWTIEHRGAIPETMQPQIKDWIFGCDLCQEVCPFNHKPKVTGESQFRQGVTLETRTPLMEILELASEESFRREFGAYPLLRPKREGIIRNALIVAVNQNAVDTLPAIRSLAAGDSNDSIRRGAAQAARSIAGESNQNLTNP